MLTHLLFVLALASLSIVSNAAATLMDADQADSGAIPNAVLHKDVALNQGGGSDKDVVDVSVAVAADSCLSDHACSDYNQPAVSDNPQVVESWFAAQDGSSALQPLLVALMIIVLIVFVLSRKSISTK
jgi:hypothetical protein